MADDDDIIADFMARVAKWVPADRALVIERELRQHWGASKIYVRKTPVAVKAQIISEMRAGGATVNIAAKRAGCTRRRGYMILAKLRRREW